MLRQTLATLLISAMTFAGACSHNKRNPQDPLEGLNREFFGLNKTLDRAIIKPVSYVYLKYLPQPVQSGVGNFFDNLRELPNIANDVLQLKFAYATHDTSRFLINSTIGIFGFFDPAGSLGLDHRREDFGQTLYHWGYKNSTYLVLPIIGPTTIRDALGMGVDYSALSLWPWIHADSKKYALLAVDYIDIRARLLRREPVIDVLAVDEYAFYRDAYLQHRKYQFEGDKGEDGDDEVNPYLEEDYDETSSHEVKPQNSSTTDRKTPDAKAENDQSVSSSQPAAGKGKNPSSQPAEPAAVKSNPIEKNSSKLPSSQKNTLSSDAMTTPQEKKPAPRHSQKKSSSAP